jgi:signal transduction histidine kinase
MVPRWVEGELVLARRIDGHVEGVWLDWPGLRAWLLHDVEDLLPGARLEPAARGERADAARFLAALPLALLPGPPPVLAAAGAPLRLVLGIAWSGVLLAVVAAIALLAGAMALSERRATFVSAVTHELRTPLTTFRAYTEMLTEGMVTDETQKAQYLATLRSEAGRLSHLVENVLLFARVERGRGGELTRPVDLGELLGRVVVRLEERAAAAGMTVELAPAPEGLVAHADAGAVEQILFNLVDNACKYAAEASDRVIRISARAAGREAIVTVADRGPGISAAQRARLFRPFGRSAAQAAGHAPGVGLGLALCRRLARAMRGDLVLEAGPGAVFSLHLRSV